MATDCIFCKIVDGEIPADIVFQNEEFIAFRDINPVAPLHVLIVPRIHIVSLAEVSTEHEGLMGRLVLLAKNIAESENVSASGFRLITNCGNDSGQIVPHLHFHLLGGRKLGRMG